MDNSNILFEILLTDYKSLRNQKSNIFIIKYFGILTISITQVILGCPENYFLPPILIVLLLTLFVKDSNLSKELRNLNESMSQFTNSPLIQEYQQRKYFEEKSWLKSRYYKFAEIYIWTVISVFICYYKIKYGC